MQKRGVCGNLLLSGLLSFSFLMGGSTGLAAAGGQAPDMQWEHHFGAGIHLMEAQETQDDGYTVMGTTNDGSVYLARTDGQGNPQGSNTFQLRTNNTSGVEKNVTVTSIRYTQDGGYLLGGTVPGFYFRYNDYVIAKMGNKGEIQWKQAYDSGAFGHFNMVRETKDGGSVDAIFTESLNAGSFHTAVEKRDRGGNKEWATVLGGGRADSPIVQAKSVQQTADGGFIVGGVRDESFSIWKLNASGTIEWDKTYGFGQGHVVQTPDGGYAIAGSNAAGETVLLKTDASGAERRSSTIGSGQAVSVMNTKDGGYLIGTSQYVVKTDALASVQWSKPVNALIKAVPSKDGGAVTLASPDLVMKLAGSSAPVPQGGLQLDSEEYSLSVGQMLDTVLTSVYDNQRINVTRYGTYATADPSIASVDSSGNITGLKYGQTVLTATYKGMQTKANVYIYGGNTATGLKLDSEDYSLSSGVMMDTKLTVEKDGKTMNVTGQGTYSMRDTSVATVDASGNITGLKRGVTVLTAAYNGMKVNATVYVY